MIYVKDIKLINEEINLGTRGGYLSALKNAGVEMTIHLDYINPYESLEEAKLHLLRMLMEEVKIDTSCLKDYYPEYYV